MQQRATAAEATPLGMTSVTLPDEPARTLAAASTAMTSVPTTTVTKSPLRGGACPMLATTTASLSAMGVHAVTPPRTPPSMPSSVDLLSNTYEYSPLGVDHSFPGNFPIFFLCAHFFIILSVEMFFFDSEN